MISVIFEFFFLLDIEGFIIHNKNLNQLHVK